VENDGIVLDQSQDNAVDPIDIRDLLEVANSKVFDEENELISKNRNFEKVSSFFDLIKSENLDSSKVEPASTPDIEPDPNTENDAEEIEEERSSDEQLIADDTTKDQVEENLTPETQEKDEISEETVSSENIESPEENDKNIDNSEEFEPVDVVEKSREASEKIHDEPEDKDFNSKENSEEYERGYQDALKEFENTLLAEKKTISDFGKTLLSVRDDAASLIQELITEKVIEIASEFLGKVISETPEDLVKKVESVSSSILSSNKEIIVEFNEIDAAALKENLDLDDLPMKIREVTDLGRGEFRMLVGKSRYEQRISD
tara:strand:- start:2139 stop:3092 length:954 start_codon:yes stop_codon:yes gene_type:complete